MHHRSGDGVRSIQDNYRHARFRRRLQHVAHGSFVGVVTGAYVLYVHHQGIEFFEYVRIRMARCIRRAVHAVDGNARCWVGGIAKVFRVYGAQHAVLRAEECCQPYAVCVRQHVDGAPPIQGQSSVISE